MLWYEKQKNSPPIKTLAAREKIKKKKNIDNLQADS